jgi:hypothetical protein
MVNTTIERFPKYTDEQLDMHVVTKAIAGNMVAHCANILYYHIEFEEDAPPVQAYEERISEIFRQINIEKPETMDRVMKNLLPIRDKFSLKYILSHPDDYKKL